MLDHQKDSFRSWYILVMSGCMLKQLLFPSSRIILFTLVSSSTQTLPWNLNTPSLPFIKYLAFSMPSNSSVFYSLESINYFSFIKPRKSLDMVKWLHLMTSSPKTTYNYMSLNFSTNSHSLTIIWDAFIVFLLKSFKNSIHRLYLMFNSLWSKRYFKLLWWLKTWNCSPYR